MSCLQSLSCPTDIVMSPYSHYNVSHTVVFSTQSQPVMFGYLYPANLFISVFITQQQKKVFDPNVSLLKVFTTMSPNSLHETVCLSCCIALSEVPRYQTGHQATREHRMQGLECVYVDYPASGHESEFLLTVLLSGRQPGANQLAHGQTRNS